MSWLEQYKQGGMIKRADGSYSQRGLWDNIRANAGSGKKPTKEMLRQERKIKKEYQPGGLWQSDKVAWGDSVLGANVQKPWVKDLFNPFTSDANLGYGEGDYGTYWVHPIGKREGIQFPNKDQAQWFMNYAGEQKERIPYQQAVERFHPKGYQTGGAVSIDGYKNTSPDRFNSFNIIPSGNITMDEVNHPLLGIDNLGNKKLMVPGADYKFPGQVVMEFPLQNLPKQVKVDSTVMGKGKPSEHSNFSMPLFEEGGYIEEMKNGGIPQRYKNMGFTHVGQKKSGDGQHKWKVLAKKGDSYKVVQGGYRGMQDFKQHHSETRRDNFWSRMGGRDSSKAKDPFSPLYWHKRFGTWEYGGYVPTYQQGGPRQDLPKYMIPAEDPYQRSHYDHVTGKMYLTPEQYDNPDVYNHEAFHEFQDRMGRLSVPGKWEGPLKRPSMLATPELQGAYFNRQGLDANILGNRFIQKHPEFQFVPGDVLYDKYIDAARYGEPWTVEGEAKDFENYMHKKRMQGGGPAPIYVSSDNDPQYKSFQDSSYLHNFGQRLLSNYKRLAGNDVVEVKKGSSYDKMLREKVRPEQLMDNSQAIGVLKNDMLEFQSKGNKSIKPNDFVAFISNPDNSAKDILTGRSFLNLFGKGQRVPGARIPQWKEPVQQVIYQPSTIPTQKNIIVTKQKPTLQHIPKIGVSGLEELPVNIQQQNLQYVNPEDANLNPEVWLSPEVQGNFFRPAGFYKQGILPGQNWVPNRKYGGWLSKYQEGGWKPSTTATINTPLPTGVSAGTVNYQDWEHKPSVATPDPQVLEQIRREQELSSKSLIGKARQKLESIPFPLNMPTYPIEAATRIFDPHYHYTQGYSGYSAFPGAGQAMMDADAIVGLGEGIAGIGRSASREMRSIPKSLERIKTATIPVAPLSPSETNLLKNTRVVGSIAQSGSFEDAAMLQKLMGKVENLPDDHLKNLTGFTKDEIKQKIENLKSAEIAKKQKEASAVSDDSDFARFQERLRRHQAQTQQQAQTISNLYRDIFSEERVPEPVLNPSTHSYSSEGIDPQRVDAIRRRFIQGQRLNLEEQSFLQRANQALIDDIDLPSPSSWETYTAPSYYNWGPLVKPVEKPTITSKLTDWYLQKKGLAPIQKTAMPVTETLLPSLHSGAGVNPAAKILQAYNKVKAAPKGQSFIPAHSMSTDSYPASLGMINKIVNEDIANINYHGHQGLNNLGFPTQAGISNDVMVREINQHLQNINKNMQNKIPYAYLDESGSIQAPILTGTRKKYGGTIKNNWLKNY